MDLMAKVEVQCSICGKDYLANLLVEDGPMPGPPVVVARHCKETPK